MRPKKIHKPIEVEVSQEDAQEVDPIAQTIELTAEQVLEPDLVSDVAVVAPSVVEPTPVETAKVYVIEPARDEDRPWIADLWEQNAATFGGGFQQLWEGYTLDKAAGGNTFHIDVCRPAEGFHIYTTTANGVFHRALAVAVPRQGVGRALLSSFKGKMFRFVVPIDNTAAIAFYDSLKCPSQGCLRDGSTNRMSRQYAGIFPGTVKAVPVPLPVGDKVPEPPVKTNWRKG